MVHLKNFFIKYLTKLNFLVVFALNVYFAVLGLFWILFYVYFRLFKSYKGYIIVELKTKLSLTMQIFFMLFVIIHFSVVLNIILVLYREKYNKKPNPFFAKVSEKLSSVANVTYWKPLDYLYKKIEKDVPGSGRFFIFLEQHWTSTQKSRNYFYFVIFLFDVLPRSIMAVTFFIDVMFFGQINYFVSTLSLIFIPILFNITLKLMLSFGKNNIPIITNYFAVLKGQGNKYVNRDKTICYYDNYYFEIKKEYQTVINPEEEITMLERFILVYFYAYEMKKDIEIITPYLTLLTSSLYLIAGITRVIILYL